MIKRKRSSRSLFFSLYSDWNGRVNFVEPPCVFGSGPFSARTGRTRGADVTVKSRPLSSSYSSRESGSPERQRRGGLLSAQCCPRVRRREPLAEKKNPRLISFTYGVNSYDRACRSTRAEFTRKSVFFRNEK